MMESGISKGALGKTFGGPQRCLLYVLFIITMGDNNMIRIYKNCSANHSSGSIEEGKARWLGLILVYLVYRVVQLQLLEQNKQAKTFIIEIPTGKKKLI